MTEPPAPAPKEETCPVCGMATLREIRCKVVCTNCRTIVKTCADLESGA